MHVICCIAWAVSLYFSIRAWRAVADSAVRWALVSTFITLTLGVLYVGTAIEAKIRAGVLR